MRTVCERKVKGTQMIPDGLRGEIGVLKTRGVFISLVEKNELDPLALPWWTFTAQPVYDTRKGRAIHGAVFSLPYVFKVEKAWGGPRPARGRSSAAGRVLRPCLGSGCRRTRRPTSPSAPKEGSSRARVGGRSPRPGGCCRCIPRRLRATFPRAAGKKNAVLWRRGEGCFVEGPLADRLLFRPDSEQPDSHGFVEPVAPMPVGEYQAALAATRDQWVIDEECAMQSTRSSCTRNRRRQYFEPRVEPLEDRTMLSAGDLDPGFGSGGKVLTPFTADARPQGVLLQSDGKIVVAGTVGNSPTSDLALARYTGRGMLDQTFGSGGLVVTDINSSEDPGLTYPLYLR
jgi:hypothetical protein